MKNTILILVGAFFMQACSKNVTYTALENTKWTLTAWPGQTIPASAKATINFNGGQKVNGKSFCNSFGGTISISTDTISFGQIISTKMFCPDFNKAENKFLADLQMVNHLKRKGDKLQLLKGDQQLMEFSKNE